MKYTITVTDTQVKAINTALEEFFRLRMRQTFDLAEDIAFCGFNYKSHTEEDFENRLARREEAMEILNRGIRIASGDTSIYDIGETARVCEDIWQVIRHQLWLDNPKRLEYTVDSREPLPVSGEPLAKIEREED